MFDVHFHDALKHLAKEIKTASAWKLFAILPVHLDYHEFRRLDQTKIASELGTTGASVSRGMAELLKLGVVEKQGKGPVIAWKLTPDYGWRGDVESYEAAASRRKLFPKRPGGGPRVVAEGISQKGTQQTTTDKPKREQKRLNLLRPIVGGATG